MEIFDIVYLGEKNLQESSTTVNDNEMDFVRENIEKMFNTMYHNNGIGLAAPQIGINKRFIIIDIGDVDGKQNKYVMINPEIISMSEEKTDLVEGCLSLPGSNAKVTRPENITVKWLDENSIEHIQTFSGLMAKCVQHEIDHLNGILFIDHLSSLKKGMVVKKVMKKLNNRS